MQLRQGDIMLERVDHLPKVARSQFGRKQVLALGEVTGHSHVLEGRSIVVEDELEQKFIEVLAGGGVLKHQEHAPIEVPPGSYKIVRQREYSPEEVRQVAD
jgi:hypothetical protein